MTYKFKNRLGHKKKLISKYDLAALLLIISASIFLFYSIKNLNLDKGSKVSLLKTDVSNAYELLNKEEKKTLKSSVYHYCSVSYHRETCLHYYITCGAPCKNLLSKQAKKIMKYDFNVLMTQRFSKENRVPASYVPGR